MVLFRRIGTTAGRACGAVLALALAGGFAAGAAAQEKEGGVTLKMNKLYNENGKGRVMVTVNNENREPVDVDVTCEFMKQKLPVSKGHNTATRVPPLRSDEISVTSTRVQEFDSARCKVERVQK